jgi:hypothetical protein
MSLHPPVTVTFAPRRLLVQSMQSVWDDALRFVLGVPDRPTSLIHHLIASDDVTRGAREERFEKCILELFQAGSRFFLTARAMGFRKSVVA